MLSGRTSAYRAQSVCVRSFYNCGQVLIAPSEASDIDVGITKITVSSDPFVRGASIKVAEWGLCIELYVFIVTLSRSEMNVRTHSYALQTHPHLHRHRQITGRFIYMLSTDKSSGCMLVVSRLKGQNSSEIFTFQALRLTPDCTPEDNHAGFRAKLSIQTTRHLVQHVWNLWQKSWRGKWTYFNGILSREPVTQCDPYSVCHLVAKTVRCCVSNLMRLLVYECTVYSQSAQISTG